MVMSKRVHFGYFDKDFIGPYLWVPCLHPYRDEESYKHISYTKIEKRVTCRSCLKDLWLQDGDE